LIEPRIYRAAFAPALLAVVIAAFSLESRPQPVPQALAADVLFDGNVALAGAQRIAQTQPDRRPGKPGDQAMATDIARRLRGELFNVALDRFHEQGHALVNVFGRRAGQSTRQLVVVAPRDAAGVPDLTGSAADTAALLEIARALHGAVTKKTLVLASVDGSTLGAAGARRLAGKLSAAGPVEAVIVVSDLAVPKARGSLLVPWGETAARGGLQLQRTLGESIRLEVESGGAGEMPGTAGQFARLAFPLAIGDQAPFVDQGLNAVRLSGSGELPPRGGTRPDVNTLGSLGRATLRAVFAYDAAGQSGESPSAFLIVAQKLLPSWALSLLVAALLLPLFAAAIDSFARTRRRREPVMAWLRWTVAGVVPFLVALALAEFLVLIGVAPEAQPVPVSPATHPLDGAAAASLGICTAALVAAWLWLRPLVAGSGRLPAPGTPGAGAALAITLCIAAFAVWVVNPFAAFALLPAFHLWLLTSASPVPARRPVGVALVLAGLAIPLLVALVTISRLSLDPLGAVWYGFLLVTGHQVGLYTALVLALLAACFAAALRIALARRAERQEPGGPSVRGPGGYAGPGSLGGTESALPR
jgi:hypothetical protein